MVASGYTNPTALSELPEGWRRKAIEELCENVTTGGTPSRRNELFYRGYHDWFKTGELKDAYLENSEEKITSDALENSAAKLFPPETVLMAMYGDGKTITSLGILRREAASNQACCAMIADRKLCEPRFLFYALRRHREDFIRLASGGAQRNLSGKLIRRFALNTPPLSEQRVIASVLGALDDKIELNRQMNETLETLAQTLFKNWFTDAANKLPKGWRESTIGEEVRVVGGSTPSTSRPEFWGGGTHHWATPKDLASLTSPVLLDTERKITNAGIEQISSGLLPVGTVLLSSRAPIGYLAIAEVPVAVNQGFIAIVCNSSLPNHYVRLWTQQNMETIKGRANGTTFMEISKSNFRPLPVLVPPQPLLDEFQKQVESLYRRIVSNLQESQTLAALRDALLPKLLSGELRVPQAEQIVANIIPLFTEQPAKPARKTTDEFVEAVTIAYLTRQLFDPMFPLGRKRYNKFAYLAHRKADDDVAEFYLKKAAGPYSPWAKYQGPEKIALAKGYIKNAKVGELVGFAPGDKIAEIERYAPNYPICAAVDWVVKTFRYKKTDELELLATVDYAALDLLREKKPISLDAIKHIIATNKEWAAKLKREIFSDANITRALTELRTVFPGTYS